jgi:hypothetical protein
MAEWRRSKPIEEKTITRNEEIIRNGYAIAERQDAEGFIDTFTGDGTFTNESL